MSPRRSGLGRGLEALIPDLQPAVEEVDVDLIAPNPQQPRTAFDPESLAELAESIREHGIIQPLIVSRPDATSMSTSFTTSMPGSSRVITTSAPSARISMAGT